MKLIKSLATATLFALVSTVAVADHMHATSGDISVAHTWTRATPPKAMAAGGFAEITNAGSENDKLISASSPAANRVELHEMAVSDGVMVMRQVEGGITIPAGETFSLKPGSYHIMFMELKAPFKEGEMVPVKLVFEKAGEVDIKLAVEKIGAKGMDHSKMDHSKMDHGKMKMEDHSDHGNK